VRVALGDLSEFNGAADRSEASAGSRQEDLAGGRPGGSADQAGGLLPGAGGPKR
jgi:hypothetical protein